METKLVDCVCLNFSKFLRFLDLITSMRGSTGGWVDVKLETSYILCHLYTLANTIIPRTPIPDENF